MASLRCMKILSQSPTDPGFVQNPYPFYDRARAMGELVFWQDYDKPAAISHNAVHSLLRDRRFGREVPSECAEPGPAHLAPWLAIEAHSLLDAEPPRHTRLRALITRAFTSRTIGALETDIETVCHDLIDLFPSEPFDLIQAYCQHIPVIIICRLLGLPERMGPQLLSWSHAMVAMYQAGRTRATEDAAVKASRAFTAYLRDYIEQRRQDPRDDLITRLIAAQQQGQTLSRDELIATCVLLLNAGHEATVHTLGNGTKAVLDHCDDPVTAVSRHPDTIVEEVLRFDPPLHMFTRYAYEEVTLFGTRLRRGDQVALLLAAANRDPNRWDDPNRFDPARVIRTNTSFGGGLHFCVGAPLARLELRIALTVLLQRCPGLRITAPPVYADSYHFHGLERLMVTR